MKIALTNNLVRHAIKIILAMTIALIINYFFSFSREGWLPLAAFFVMLTKPGNAFYQGTLHFLLLVLVIVLVSCFFSNIHLLDRRLYDAFLGAAIGISCNSFIFPIRVDVEFRQAIIPIIQSYKRYFLAIIAFLLDQNQRVAVDDAQRVVEQDFQKLPDWVYGVGFDRVLQKGHRYFFMKIIQLGEILFVMHYIAKQVLSEDLLTDLRVPLLAYTGKVEQFFSALLTVFELKKITEGVVDFSEEIEQMEKIFKKVVPLTLELLNISEQYVYLAEFIYTLRELRNVLFTMGQALR